MSKVLSLKVDGGWSWVVCASIFVWNFIFASYMKMQGIMFLGFLELYMQGATATSKVNFTQGIVVTILSPLGGYISDQLSQKTIRWVLGITVLCSATLIALSGQMPTLSLTILVYGVFNGTCLAIAIPSSLSLPGRYFVEKRTLAYSISFMGGSLGTLLLPIIYTTSVNQYNFSGAMIILAGIWTHGLLVPVCAWPLPAVEKQSHNPVTTPSVNETIPLLSRGQQEDGGTRWTCRQLFESCWHGLSFWCRPDLIITLLTLFLGMFSYYSIFFILPPMGQELGLSKISVSLVLAITSVTEVIGRVFAGSLVDRYKMPKDKFLMVTYGICAILGIVTSFFLSENVLYVYGILFGSVGGTCVMWCVPMIMELVDDSHQGAATGMFPFLAGLATGLGPLVIGAVRDATGSYINSFRVCTAFYSLGVLLHASQFLFNRSTK